MAQLKCAACGSERVIPNARILDTGKYSRDELTAHVGDGDPAAMLLTEPIEAKLRADICCGCGVAAIRVCDPEALWKAYSKMPEQDRP